MSKLDSVLTICGRGEHRFTSLLDSYGYHGLFGFVDEHKALSDDGAVFYDHLGTYLRLLKSGSFRVDFNYFDRLSPDIKTSLREGNAKLLLDHSAETIPIVRKQGSYRDDMREIYSGLEDIGIDPARLLIINANMRARESHDEVCNELSVSSRLSLLSLNYFLYYSHILFRKQFPSVENHNARITAAERTVSKGERRKQTFLCQNRKPKDFRSAVVAFLLSRGFDKNSYISYMGPTVDAKFGEFERFSDNVRNSLRRLLHDDDVERGASLLCEGVPLTLDKDIEATVRDLAFDFSEQWTYQNSYVNIATETLFSDGQVLFPTEKSLKPIIYLQPFILVGDPGHLQLLREHGFKTFSPLIDESYDEVTDPSQRMQKILSEIDRIGRMTNAQVHELYCELWNTLVHNFNHFVNETPRLFRNTLKQSLVPSITHWAAQRSGVGERLPFTKTPHAVEDNR